MAHIKVIHQVRKNLDMLLCLLRLILIKLWKIPSDSIRDLILETKYAIITKWHIAFGKRTRRSINRTSWLHTWWKGIWHFFKHKTHSPIKTLRIYNLQQIWRYLLPTQNFKHALTYNNTFAESTFHKVCWTVLNHSPINAINHLTKKLL